MKRDANLLRDIMLFLEEAPPYDQVGTYAFGQRFPAADPFELAAHVDDLIRSGFVEGVVIADGRRSPPRVNVSSINPSGYDFINVVRKDTIWAKVRTGILETGKAWTLQLLLDYAANLAKGDQPHP